MISKPNFTLGKRGSTWTLWGSAVIASRNKEDEICSLSFTGEGNGNPLQCSCLENPRDGGARWAAVYGVAQSQTWLMWLSSSSSSSSPKWTNSCIINKVCSLFTKGWGGRKGGEEILGDWVLFIFFWNRVIILKLRQKEMWAWALATRQHL